MLVTDDIEQVRRALALPRDLHGRLPLRTSSGRTSTSFSVLADAADYVIVEADGSKRLPARAPANDATREMQTVCVVGASGFGNQSNRPYADGVVLCTCQCT